MLHAGSKSKSVTIVTFVIYAFQALSILLTIFRLWYRWHIQRLWWEDAWAAFALFFGTIYLVSNILIYSNYHPTINMITSWLVIYTFTCMTWAVRVSMILSIVRVMPPTKTRRFKAIIMISVVTIIAALTVSLKIYLQKTCICGCILNSNNWTTKCHILEIIVIWQFCGGCVADTILLAVPMRLLRDMKFPLERRRMMSWLFSSSILITIASMFNSSVQLSGAHRLSNFAISFEIFVSLTVCNLLVVVTFIYRTFQKQLRRRSSDYSMEWSSTGNDCTSSPLELTTIELGMPTESCMTEEVILTGSKSS